ncbi:PAP-associated domain-containing protein [Caenorhabditis elegans]|uniref:PAP-associated domain-containing protein n=1 Tax=Caenorhabditis elegans TaxID=6239 RepID=Q19090_CAEEL|nr:PAP-associated domain-containing protein [Caenorhabditis elegans]CCD65996.1 PAP-associated domain-containing protein [Caenorhabditis elegans]|eukprot:NP_498269.1 Uncharacterized protein CELE_F01F1.11 [Caenorhabditis elegans]
MNNSNRIIPFAFKSSEHGSYEDEMMEMEDVVDVEDYMGGEKYDSYNDAKEDIKDFKTTQRMKKIHRMEKIEQNIASEKIDIIELGTRVMVSTSDKTLNEASLERTIRCGISEATFLGDISMESLVEGMVNPSAADGRFAMLGTSIMLNALKSNIKDLRGTIVGQTTNTNSESKFDKIDLSLMNLSHCQQTSYNIRATGVFSNADLQYVFSLLTFRRNAKLLNKTKQFIKAYFCVACRPRCMIWRYTLRRAGNSQRRAILNLPSAIVSTITQFLLDLTGISDANIPYDQLDPMTPLSISLGEDESMRVQRYEEACRLKDPLTRFFRDAITDCLNELREMPFCLNTGILLSPLRGREQGTSCVTWKDYEGFLKREHDLPSEANMKKRTQFEQRLCDIIPRVRRPVPN